jgi:hypothetical protein
MQLAVVKLPAAKCGFVLAAVHFVSWLSPV